MKTHYELHPKRWPAWPSAIMMVLACAGLCSAAIQGKKAGSHSAKQPQGRELFVEYCAGCHGERGDGKPASGLTLKPPALDLTGFKLSESFIRKVLQEGVPGTGMAAWKALPPEELNAITAYTASLGHEDRLSPRERVASDATLREAGRRVYVVHCASCHGDNGQGDGPEATRYRPPPANFTEMRPSFSAAARVISEGVPGSAMAAWPRLTRAEVQAVTAYIRFFYRGSAEGPAVSSKSVGAAQR